MRTAGVVLLALRARRRRVLALVAFAAVFLAAALTARLLTRQAGGHVELDRLFLVGGYPLVSALLLLGWLLGRFPLIAVLVLLAGLVSDDRASGHARLYSVRPASPLLLYGAEAATLLAVAFTLSAAIMIPFDLVMLGTWAGPATLVLILAYILVYGGLVALLSAWTRADAWIALLLATGSLVWHALRSADALRTVPPGARDLLTLLLPPQAALVALEDAFGSLQPIPWDAFGYAAAYAAALWLLAGLSLATREV